MRRLLSLAIVALWLAACQKDADVEQFIDPNADKIFAGIEADQTRVQLNSKGQTTWNQNDQIIVIGTDEYSLWEFDGATGDRSGSFTKIGDGGATGLNFDKYYSIYPFSKFIGYSQSSDGTPALFTKVESTQSYADKSYANDTNTMIGTSTDGKNFTFKNLCGYLRLSLKGNKLVEKIELTSIGGEPLSGTFYFFTPETENLYWYETGSNSLTLDCGEEGVMLSQVPTEFYFVLPPITFASGISANIYFSDGTIYPKSTQKSISISRNVIQPMATIDTSEDIDWQIVTIRHIGDMAYAPQFYGEEAVTGYIYWGDGEFSFLNQTQHYIYTDSASEHTITTNSLDATLFYTESCKGISEIDFTNF